MRWEATEISVSWPEREFGIQWISTISVEKSVESAVRVCLSPCNIDTFSILHTLNAK
jgi:hypothetical protein